MAAVPQLTAAELFRYTPDPQIYLRRPGAPSWLDELDLHDGAPFVKMGTHSVGFDEWFVIDDAYDQEVALRRTLLEERRDLVFDCAPSADAAAEETLELVTDWLRARGGTHPEVMAKLETSAPDHPLAAAGMLVPDDLCLMVPRDGDWWFDGGILCFPSIWRLADKIGQRTTDVHDTVAHYREELSVKVDRFFDHMRPDRMVSRRNLSVKPWSLLFVPTTKPDQPVGELIPEADGSPFWLRTERQTLRLLPRTGAILFTIKVQIAPARVLLLRPDIAARMASMYRSFDASMGGYKVAANDLTVGFVPWLERVADGP